MTGVQTCALPIFQRATRAKVTVAGEVVGELPAPGLVVLVGVTPGDGAAQVEHLARKVAELRILRDEHLVQRSAAMGDVLGARLHDELAGHPAVVDIRGRGLFFGIELRCSRDAVVAAALERDVWVYPAGSGPVADAVIVAPPFVVTDDEIDRLVVTMRAAVDTVTA